MNIFDINDFESASASIDTKDLNYVEVQIDGGKSPYYSLEDMLSGGTISVELEIATRKTSADIPIDTSVARNLAYFGSLYAIVSMALSKIAASSALRAIGPP